MEMSSGLAIAQKIPASCESTSNPYTIWSSPENRLLNFRKIHVRLRTFPINIY